MASCAVNKFPFREGVARSDGVVQRSEGKLDIRAEPQSRGVFLLVYF
jgi:hypothetical protein